MQRVNNQPTGGMLLRPMSPGQIGGQVGGQVGVTNTPSHIIGSGPTPPGMNSFGTTNTGGTFNAANYSGLTDLERNKLASIATGKDFFMTDAFLNSIKNKYNAPLTVIGKDEAWLSPDELRDKTNALEGYVTGGSSGAGGSESGLGGPGGGSGGYGSGQVGGGSGSNLGDMYDGGSNQNGYSSPGGINQFPNIPITIPGGYNPGGNGPNSPRGGIPGTQVSGGSPLSMVKSSAGNALDNYFNTAGYQLTEGQGAVDRFQESPGYQFAVDEALKQVQRQGASRGLLDSGAGLRAMTDRAQGMANQEYNNWQANQQAMYNQYQNRLQGLAGGPTGSDQAFALGQGVGNNYAQSGNNIASLLANLGNSLFGGIVGAGGAQAQNVSQAGNMQAQILAGNLQTQMMLAALARGGR